MGRGFKSHTWDLEPVYCSPLLQFKGWLNGEDKFGCVYLCEKTIMIQAVYIVYCYINSKNIVQQCNENLIFFLVPSIKKHKNRK